MAKDLRYILKKFPIVERLVSKNIQDISDIDSNISATISGVTFNEITNTLEFTFVDLDGNVITNPVDLSALSQSQFQIENVVNTFDDLALIVSPTLFEFAYVQNEQGTQWLPGSLGGTYYGVGLYIWNGVEWSNDQEEVYNELNNILLRLNELVDSVTAGIGIAVDNSDPNNPVVSIDLVTQALINNALQPGDNISELTNDTGFVTQTDTDALYYSQTDLNGGQLDNRYFTETEVISLINTAVESLTKPFFQASADVDQNNIVNVDTILDLVENKNSDNTVYTFAGNALTIDKTGTFNFRVRTLGNTATGARERLDIRLQRDIGTGFQNIPLSEGAAEGSSYHRNTAAGRDVADIDVLLNVTTGDTFRVVVISPTAGVNILAIGTNFIVEEK